MMVPRRVRPSPADRRHCRAVRDDERVWLRGSPAAEEAADQVKPLDEYTRGATAESWPARPGRSRGRHSATLLVLSPICNTCNKVAAEMAGYRPDQLDGSLGIVVSCNNREKPARRSSIHTPLAICRTSFDEGGSWVTATSGST